MPTSSAKALRSNLHGVPQDVRSSRRGILPVTVLGSSSMIGARRLLRQSTAARDEGRDPVERFALLVECLVLYYTPKEAARAVVTMCTALPRSFHASGTSTAEQIAAQHVELGTPASCPLQEARCGFLPRADRGRAAHR